MQNRNKTRFFTLVASSALLLCHSLAQAAPPADTSQAFGDMTPAALGFMNTGTPWKTWVAIPVATRHFDRQAVVTDNLSEDNPGLGIERSNGVWHWMAGAYRNSNRRTTAYGMLGYTPAQLDLGESRLNLGGALGLATGYRNNTTQRNYPVIPVGGALLSLETPWHAGLNLFIVPTIKSFNVEGFAAVQIKLTF